MSRQLSNKVEKYRTVMGEMGLPSRGILALVLSSGIFVSGCDSGSFLPPRPPELGRGGAGAGPRAGAGARAGTGNLGSVSSAARSIELITGALKSEESEGVKKIARIQAGLDATLIHIAVAGEQGNPTETAALIKSTLARNPLALVLYFLDVSQPDLAGAIGEAREKGVPVVAIAGPPSAEHNEGRSTGSAGSPSGPLIRVVPESLKVASSLVVEAAIRNARNAKLKPEEGAVLMINSVSDALIGERAQALRESLQSKGIKTIDVIEFSGDLELAKKRLTELLQANRKPVVVVSADHIGLTASFQAMSDLREQRPYVVGGFTPEESGGNMTKTGEFAAVAIYSPDRMIRRAVNVAAALGRGEKVPDKVEVIVPVLTSPEKSTTSKMYMMNKRSNSGPDAK
jgi:ABC-type sugar transport system substrate-binding protein